MPLEVKVSLDREVAIYLSGETVKVTVTVKNEAKGKHATTEQLAWGSVQFICERTIGSSLSSHRQRPTTSVTRSASTVYSSQPEIIFCELQLAPGQTQQFSCDIPISRDAVPPTFRGHHVKYSNRVTVAVSHVLAHIKICNLPIRIIPSVGLEAKISTPVNPFLASTLIRPSVVDTVLETVDDLTMARKSIAFQLNLSSKSVAMLTLPKKAFKLGEDVCGFLDFGGSETTCAQYLVSLETEEASGNDEEDRKPFVKRQAMSAPICFFTPDSAFRLNIPLTATPTFSTDAVELKWRIKLMFVLTKEPFDFEQIGGQCIDAPEEIAVESLSWSTEILVLPCKPQNAALLDNSFPNTVSLAV